ncbi:response regulator [Nocardioides bruguierae]|uniref:Response regulator n=1 Tax=Nocardioides bruguierae TaxID=2945102 RepID=A0A9X2II82_9ACTN|nr:response regulator [Nocardioides bruguierae]MCM0622540.1 response regulator [Nocardioides bruguierae]
MSYALFIDDDPQIVASATDLVRAQGLTLETASTWDEGLEKFYAYSPDLVISDFNLPGSEMGLRLLLTISKLRPSVRVILLSAYLNEDDAAKIRGLHLVHDVVIKTDPVATARRILQEVSDAANRADDSTDWVAFSHASQDVREVDDSIFDELDAYLISNRLPADGGKADA